MLQPRTSETDPLRIAEVPIAPGGGIIGITFCPGKCGDSVHGAPWQRDLPADIRIIAERGAKAVLTLVEDHEMRLLSVPDFGERIGQHGIDWHHLPIVDVEPPGADFRARWPKAGAAAVDLLKHDAKVLVHCRGGLGRAGTVAACLLAEMGADPREAIRRVRTARPGAIETAEQEQYVLRYVPQFRQGVDA